MSAQYVPLTLDEYTALRAELENLRATNEQLSEAYDRTVGEQAAIIGKLRAENERHLGLLWEMLETFGHPRRTEWLSDVSFRLARELCEKVKNALGAYRGGGGAEQAGTSVEVEPKGHNDSSSPTESA